MHRLVDVGGEQQVVADAASGAGGGVESGSRRTARYDDEGVDVFGGEHVVDGGGDLIGGGDERDAPRDRDAAVPGDPRGVRAGDVAAPGGAVGRQHRTDPLRTGRGEVVEQADQGCRVVGDDARAHPVVAAENVLAADDGASRVEDRPDAGIFGRGVDDDVPVDEGRGCGGVVGVPVGEQDDRESEAVGGIHHAEGELGVVRQSRRPGWQVEADGTVAGRAEAAGGDVDRVVQVARDGEDPVARLGRDARFAAQGEGGRRGRHTGGRGHVVERRLAGGHACRRYPTGERGLARAST